MSHRVLCVESCFEGSTDCKNLDEYYNIKDYDTVFLDLTEVTIDDLLSIENSTPAGIDAPIFPEPYQVGSHLFSGKDLIVLLPQRLLESWENVLSWLPGGNPFISEPGEYLDESSIYGSWRWYFEGSDVSWSLVNPNSHIANVSYDHIAKTSAGDGVASVIKVIGSAGLSEGDLVVLPLFDGWSFEEFAEGYMDHIVRDLSARELDEPSWVSDYVVPGEEEKKEEIEQTEVEIAELKEELEEKEDDLESLQRYKVLLWGNEGLLENLVPEVFEEMGFKVNPEVSHHRDSLIELTECTLVVESTGTSRGIGKDKCRQLENWVGDYEMDDPDGDYRGILVINPLRKERPDERSGYRDPSIESYMEKRGYKILETPVLFEWFTRYLEGELSREDVKKRLLSDEVVIGG